MHYFYSTNIKESTIHLSKEESHHAARVLRLNVGDKVGVFDGLGTIYTCSISTLTKSECILSIEKAEKSGRKASGLSVFIAPTKNIDRLEWFLEKATEIGVFEIILLISEHSERRKVRFDRLEKVLVSAMKQSMNPYLPILRPLMDFNQAIELSPEKNRFIAHCANKSRLDLYPSYDTKKKNVIMIGPEGDFSSKEIEAAEKLGWQGVSMGHQRLRTETAGVLAVHMFSLREEFN
jgi:16S rRNA (uracil1498-N3)-methyltransferase